MNAAPFEPSLLLARSREQTKKGRRCAVNVRFGSLAEIAWSNCDVRSYTESGHFSGTLAAESLMTPWKDSVSHFSATD